MNTTLTMSDVDMRAKLSALWIYVFLNMIFRDLHELGRPGFLKEMMTGVVGGIRVTDGLMLRFFGDFSGWSRETRWFCTLSG